MNEDDDYDHWDGESYCINKDGRPATERILMGMIHDSPVYELMCTECTVIYYRQLMNA